MAVTEDFQPTLSLAERRINVDPDSGRIAVRIARWEDAHSGLPGAVKMPRRVNVEAAHVGRARLEDGSDLAVANLPMGTVHAPQGLTAAQAAQLYENTGTSIARVRYSVDDEGIRADGLLFGDVDEQVLDRLVAAAPSGDWRALSLVRRPEDFEHTPSDFAGACLVNLPGYSDTFSQSPATPLRLVASAASMLLIDEVATPEPAEANSPETPDGCDPAAPPCDGCTCGRAAEAPAVEPEVDDEVLVDKDGNEVEAEVLTELLASMGYRKTKRDRSMKSSAAVPDDGLTEMTYQALVDRVEVLERIVAEAILSI